MFNKAAENTACALKELCTGRCKCGVRNVFCVYSVVGLLIIAWIVLALGIAFL